MNDQYIDAPITLDLLPGKDRTSMLLSLQHSKRARSFSLADVFSDEKYTN